MGSRARPRAGSGAPAGRRRPAKGRASASGGTRRTSAPGGRSRAERRKLQRKVKRKRRRSAVREIPLLVGVAVLIALVLKTFLVQAFVIPSGSMEQTIRIGDRVLVDKLTPWFGAEPHRGDVVVFRDPGGWLDGEQTKATSDPVVLKQLKEGLSFIGLLPSDNEKDLIKRVIGVGGDHVKCCDAKGRITVNGVPLDEKDYLYPGNAPSATPFDVTVPKGRLWVMGDHRAYSADSRFHRDSPFGGTVSVDSVVGRAMWIGWPVGHWTRLEEPKTFASVGRAGTGTAAARPPSHRVDHENPNGMTRLPTPAELPLVMGVVGLRRLWRGRRHGVRSWRGGCGGWRTVGTRRRGAPRRPRGGERLGPGRRHDHRERRDGGRRRHAA
ncbi:signal peptidase I [Streptomyces sp. SCPE 10]|uniref:signal peptidase I n=1 Tax=Streptomyces sp. SCPE 10 TaxID=3449273 RepID=UPI003F7EA6E2